MWATEHSRRIFLLYSTTGLFLAGSLFLLIDKNNYGLFVLPVVAVVLYYYLVSLDKVLLFITFATPLAVNISDAALGSSLSVPTEPMMMGIVMVFAVNLLFRNRYNPKLLTHPMAYLVYLYLFWMLVTMLTSSMPWVSLKHLLSRIWFVVPFFFVAASVFRKKQNIHRFYVLYLAALSIVVVYTLVRHAQYGFSEDAGHWVMTPFYNDHTAYGAALAMFIPVLAGFVVYPGISLLKRILALLFLGFFVVAIIFSYTRAAWLSLFAAIIVLFVVLARIKFRWLVFAVLLAGGTVFTFHQQIIDRMEKNKQDSSSNFDKHLQSMSNISSDASNLERLNRWNAALLMFDQRPWLGWGPGTYQFVYAPFQLARDRTVISTNTGDRGTAHSEYLGPLSEEGFPGLLIVLALFGYAIYLGLKLYRSENREIRVLSLMTTLGLLTYMVHGFMNNFLSTDKLSVPFWGFIAVLVALDVYRLEEPKKES
ncbi:MAG: O-antigen ligase family protein [Bacteroidales bacterium]|nr:O-antigen ligase family protein [Bacteroidales bacterium]